MLRCDYFPLGPFALQVEYTDTPASPHIVRSQVVANGLADRRGWSTGDSKSGLAERIDSQVEAYLRGELSRFQLPLEKTLTSDGTAFQQRVWAQLLAIPAGQVCTYGMLAKSLTTAAQPIGGACRSNPLAFFVPCHRVVSKSGLGGYAGELGDGPQTAIKAWLLQHEKSIFGGQPPRAS